MELSLDELRNLRNKSIHQFLPKDRVYILRQAFMDGIYSLKQLHQSSKN